MESEATDESSIIEASEPHHLQSDMLLLSVTPTPDSHYSRLGEVSAIDLITFGTQIASGMVCSRLAFLTTFYCYYCH